MVDQADVDVDSGTYAAYLLNPPYEHAEGRRVLIYRHTQDRSPELLFDSGSSRYPIAVGISDWSDANQDGQPDLIISYDCLCDGMCSQWSDAVQIDPDGKLVDILPIRVHEFKDLDQDGMPELLLWDCREEMSGSDYAWGVSSFKIFAWLGPGSVRDISAQYLHLYTENIEAKLGKVRETYQQQMDEWAAIDMMALAHGALLDYENSGRRDEGWRIYWELTDPGHWPDLRQKATQAITRRRENLRVKYEAGLEF